MTLSKWDLGRGPFGTLRLILNLNLSYRVDLQAVDLQHVLPADLEELRLVYSVTVTAVTVSRHQETLSLCIY